MNTLRTMLRDTLHALERTDATLSGWRRQIDGGHPVRRDQVSELRRQVQDALGWSDEEDAMTDNDNTVCVNCGQAIHLAPGRDDVWWHASGWAHCPTTTAQPEDAR